MQIVSVGEIFSASGLAGAAGLNAGVPLLTLGLLWRFNNLALNPSFEFLGSTPMLIFVGVFCLIDVVVDKLPRIDHVWHICGMFVYPFAGALCFASQPDIGQRLSGPIALMLGALLAGSIHLARAVLRPKEHARQVLARSPALSAIEDVVAGALTALALTIPIGALCLLAATIFVQLELIVRARRAFIADSIPPDSMPPRQI